MASHDAESTDDPEHTDPESADPERPHPAQDHPSVARVRAALTDRGATSAAAGLRLLDDSARTAAQAAEQLGVEVAQIANSLLFDADGAPLLVMASGGHRVDTAEVATLVGASKVRRADPEFVRRHTGFAIGGVAPLGHPEPVRTLVDRDLARHEVLWAAAGHPHAVFPTTYDELVALTGGTPADVGE
jgi:prolyl-tRNA editing enzyme YbaK/EbsC (Cys-tRNA(Pro) deacylase)